MENNNNNNNDNNNNKDNGAIKIELASLKDITQIVSFAYRTFKENGLETTSLKPNYEKLLVQVTDWVMNGSVFVKRNDANPSLIDGVLTFEKIDVWWSNKVGTSIGLFYIIPKKRSFKLSLAFLNALKKCGILIIVDLVDCNKFKLKKELFKRVGFKDIGSFLIYDSENMENN